jgi:hypothetical protein
MCICADLPELIYLEDQPPGSVGPLIHVDTGDWVKLCRCDRCGQLWRIDVPDKYQPQIAVKVPAIDNWESLESKPFVLEHLIRSRGGLSEDLCVFAGCGKAAIKGVAYCAEHLYEMGARR